MGVSQSGVDLHAVARQAMRERGFLTEFPPPVRQEVARAAEPDFSSLKVTDLSAWLWSSIDNDDTRDLDQLEYAVAEGEAIRIYVAVADVSWFVPSGSDTDRAAQHNTTSVYTGVETFPMLPERLSTDLTSLVESEKRLAVVVEMLTSQDGRVTQSSVYPAIVCNRARLTYNAVAEWLERFGDGGMERRREGGTERLRDGGRESAGEGEMERGRDGGKERGRAGERVSELPQNRARQQAPGDATPLRPQPNRARQQAPENATLLHPQQNRARQQAEPPEKVDFAMPTKPSPESPLADARGSDFLSDSHRPSDVGRRILEKIDSDPPLQRQLTLQDLAASRLRERRHEAGALNFETREFRPALLPDGTLDLASREPNRAGRLIEDFMIAANQTTAGFLDGRGLPSIRRIVREPERWDRIVELAGEHGAGLPAEPDAPALEEFLKEQQRRDPEHFPDLSLAIIKLLGRGQYVVKNPGQESPGHFGLAVQDYAHSTAPNRRYPDLLTQHLLKCAFARQPSSYAMDQLEALAAHCTQKEDDANKVERFVRKCIAAVALRPRIGKRFNGMITGASEKGTWVRIAHPPVEGKLHGNVEGLQVGDRVRVKLISTDPRQGFIDFELDGTKT
ncbi:MAG TPA: RNB domain-containing ribonuclease [Acidobacteriota bacterium]